MRCTVAGLLLALLVSTPVHAIGNMTALSVVQEDCAQVGDISFGENRRWADCQVTRGRWVATIDLIDMYQAQYCLGNGQATCNQRALLVFGNRAYTPNAQLLVQRIDPEGTRYDDPLVVTNEYGRILTISAHLPDGSTSGNYYFWQAGQWLPIDTQAWLKDLAKRLPAGVRARKEILPDVDTMSASVRLYRKGDEDCCASAGVANVELGLAKRRFSLRKLNVSKTAE